MLVVQRESIQREQVLILVTDQHVARPAVPAGFRRSGNDCARCFLILCLEVLADDTVFLNGAPWEWISTTVVLTGDTTLCQIILETRAIDVDVRRIGPHSPTS